MFFLVGRGEVGGWGTEGFSGFFFWEEGEGCFSFFFERGLRMVLERVWGSFGGFLEGVGVWVKEGFKGL